MIKKTILLVAILGFTFAYAQSYDFEAKTGTYTSLSGSTSLNNGITWDDPSFEIPIGFNFTFFNSTFSNIYIVDFGLGGMLSNDTSYTGKHPILNTYGPDIIDRGWDFSVDAPTSGSLSNISYLLTGNTGSRILKIEWNNVGFFTELDNNGTSSDYTNFQLWLYEGSNIFEIHFGPNSISSPNLSYDGAPGADIIFFPEFDFDNFEATSFGLALSGNSASPDTNWTMDYYTDFINGPIPNGTIYKFIPLSISISEENLANSVIYPNPVRDFITIESEETIDTYSIYNTNGQLITQDMFSKRIDITDLQAGVYIIQLTSDNGVVNHRIIKE